MTPLEALSYNALYENSQDHDNQLNKVIAFLKKHNIFDTVKWADIVARWKASNDKKDWGNWFANMVFSLVPDNEDEAIGMMVDLASLLLELIPVVGAPLSCYVDAIHVIWDYDNWKDTSFSEEKRNYHFWSMIFGLFFITIPVGGNLFNMEFRNLTKEQIKRLSKANVASGLLGSWSPAGVILKMVGNVTGLNKLWQKIGFGLVTWPAAGKEMRKAVNKLEPNWKATSWFNDTVLKHFHSFNKPVNKNIEKRFNQVFADIEKELFSEEGIEKLAKDSLKTNIPKDLLDSMTDVQKANAINWIKQDIKSMPLDDYMHKHYSKISDWNLNPIRKELQDVIKNNIKKAQGWKVLEYAKVNNLFQDITTELIQKVEKKTQGNYREISEKLQSKFSDTDATLLKASAEALAIYEKTNATFLSAKYMKSGLDSEKAIEKAFSVTERQLERHLSEKVFTKKDLYNRLETITTYLSALGKTEGAELARNKLAKEVVENSSTDIARAVSDVIHGTLDVDVFMKRFYKALVIQMIPDPISNVNNPNNIIRDKPPVKHDFSKIDNNSLLKLKKYSVKSWNDIDDSSYDIEHPGGKRTGYIKLTDSNYWEDLEVVEKDLIEVDISKEPYNNITLSGTWYTTQSSFVTPVCATTNMGPGYWLFKIVIRKVAGVSLRLPKTSGTIIWSDVLFRFEKESIELPNTGRQVWLVPVKFKKVK